MTSFFKHRRWSDHDKYFGPFTFNFENNYKAWALVLSSTDDEDRGCNLRISTFWFTLVVALPSWLLPPERHKVFPPDWKNDAALIARLGRDWYWNVIVREFGVSLFDGLLSIMYGRRTHDSSTEQRWWCFLPWTQWRHVRHSLYDLNGVLYVDLPQDVRWDSPERKKSDIIEKECPTVLFEFNDFDNEHLTATTKIEEREWLFGTGWFKWLSWFVKPKIRRSLNITFSGETGRRKGSWKGGTIGHSIEMRSNELHLLAFLRYCAEHEMTFGSVL